MRTVISAIALLASLTSLLITWFAVQTNANKATMAEDYGALGVFLVLLVIIAVNLVVLLTSLLLFAFGTPRNEFDRWSPAASSLCAVVVVILAGWQLFIRN